MAFSSGTRLKATTAVASKENNVDVYLFGSEEQEYTKDLTQTNPDRQKYWDEYYRKVALKQRRNSVLTRLSIKQDPPDLLQVPTNRSRGSVANIDLLTRNDGRLSEDHSPTPFTSATSPSNEKKQHRTFDDDDMSPSKEKHSPKRNPKILLNGNGTSPATRKDVFTREKSSAICNIQ